MDPASAAPHIASTPHTRATARRRDAPALRISHIVRGREHAGNRVLYFVDPAGSGAEKAVPETVVLKRWRQRRETAYVFGGARLSPTLWRAVDAAFPAQGQHCCSLQLAAIRDCIARSAAARRVEHLSLPSAEALRALFAVLGPQRLETVRERHRSAEHAGLSGVPDLFLFAKDLTKDIYAIARFVEVKKPGEPLRPDQSAEILFLQALGLHARVLRLVER